MRRLKLVRLYSPDRTAPPIRSQLTLAHNALIGMSDILYLIFKLAITLWQSFDNNIRTVWHIQPGFACRKQLLTDLEFVHDAPRPSSGRGGTRPYIRARARSPSHDESIIVQR